MRIGFNTAQKCPSPKTTSFQRDLTLEELEGLKKNNTQIAESIMLKIDHKKIKLGDLSKQTMDFFKTSKNEYIQYMFGVLKECATIKK